MKRRRKTRKGPHKSLDSLQKKRRLRKQKGAPQTQGEVSLASLMAIEDIPEFSETLSIQVPEIALPEPPKRGRPTIADNILLGWREDWLYYLEECWPEIGWHLLRIRKAETGQIEDVQKIFEPCPTKDNRSLGMFFLRGSPQPVTGKELRANRIARGKLHQAIQRMRDQRPELARSCKEAEQVLKEAGEQENKIFEEEFRRRKCRLDHLEENLPKAENESKELNERVENQETYWYCSQLLDFLRGKKKYAVDPANLANALAGLLEMGWRESFARCSKMPRCSGYVRLPYRVLELTSRIWRRRPKGLTVAPTKFFQAQILVLPRKDDGIRRRLCEAWRDLRLAIEECWQAQHSEDFMPYAITSAFLRNHLRPKTLAERMLDESEMLSKNF